jgi:hypothetical protein
MENIQHPTSNTQHPRLANGGMPWSALAERSGDSAFGRAGNVQMMGIFRACESGVALRLPPQSKMSAVLFGASRLVKLERIAETLKADK